MSRSQLAGSAPLPTKLSLSLALFFPRALAAAPRHLANPALRRAVDGAGPEGAGPGHSERAGRAVRCQDFLRCVGVFETGGVLVPCPHYFSIAGKNKQALLFCGIYQLFSRKEKKKTLPAPSAARTAFRLRAAHL